MANQDVVSNIAFLYCNTEGHPDRKVFKDKRPCVPCYDKIKNHISNLEYIDEDLIETTAIAIANLSGNYVVKRLTSSELWFALRLLEDIIPYFLDKMREVEVKDRIQELKSEATERVQINGC